MGVDVGRARIGVARTDPDGLIATPVETVARVTTGTADVDLKGNTVSTLFVLDNSAGDLTIVPVTDAAATAATPKGGVQTGGGGTAADRPATGFLHAVVRVFRGLFH